MKIKRKSGFSLIEIIIVVVIISILNTIAIPSYKDYILRSQATEGIAALTNMRAKMTQYFQDNRTYVGACTSTSSAPLPTNLENFSLSCSDLGINTYTITATSSSLGFSYTIDEEDVKQTLSLPSGWALSVNKDICWIINKNGDCK
jgi:type IV pilus assembly protein PilE